RFCGVFVAQVRAPAPSGLAYSHTVQARTPAARLTISSGCLPDASAQRRVQAASLPSASPMPLSLGPLRRQQSHEEVRREGGRAGMLARGGLESMACVVHACCAPPCLIVFCVPCVCCLVIPYLPV